jgi:hypothetical protein
MSAINNTALAAYYKIVETEQTGSVAGLATKQYVIESPGTTTICQAAEVKGLKPANFPVAFQRGGVLKAFVDKGYNTIPLSISATDSKTGEVKFTQEIISITPRQINDSEFVIGPEYKKN